MDKTLVLELTGPAEILDAGIDSIARQYGWHDEVPDPANPGQTIPNPTAKEDTVREAIRKFLRESAGAWNVQAAREMAARQAAEQTVGALDMIELSPITEKTA